MGAKSHITYLTNPFEVIADVASAFSRSLQLNLGYACIHYKKGDYSLFCILGFICCYTANTLSLQHYLAASLQANNFRVWPSM